MNEIDERERQSGDINKVVRRKACTVWTDDHHAKFMEAVRQIGEESKFTLLLIKCLGKLFIWKNISSKTSYLSSTCFNNGKMIIVFTCTSVSYGNIIVIKLNLRSYKMCRMSPKRNT